MQIHWWIADGNSCHVACGRQYHYHLSVFSSQFCIFSSCCTPRWPLCLPIKSVPTFPGWCKGQWLVKQKSHYGGSTQCYRLVLSSLIKYLLTTRIVFYFLSIHLSLSVSEKSASSHHLSFLQCTTTKPVGCDWWMHKNFIVSASRHVWQLIQSTWQWHELCPFFISNHLFKAKANRFNKVHVRPTFACVCAQTTTKTP